MGRLAILLALASALCAQFTPGGGGGGGAPSGPAGGKLSGTYPNPGLAAPVCDTTGMSVNGVLVVAAGPVCNGTTALPAGTTATTQSQGDNSTKVGTTAYVDAGLANKLNGAIYTTGCVFDYQFDEGSGTTLTDHCSTNNATVSSSLWAADGSGLKFDGSHSFSFPGGVTWANLETILVAYKTTPALQGGANGNGVMLSSTGGDYIAIRPDEPILATGSGGNLDNEGVLNAYGWSVEAITMSGSAVVLYHNGIPQPAYLQHSNTVTLSGTSAIVGDYQPGSGTGNGFVGQIGWLVGYTGVLTAAQIQQTTQAILQGLSKRGVNVRVGAMANRAWIMSGDSISVNLGNSWQGPNAFDRIARSLVPIILDPVNVSVSGVTISTLVSNDPTNVDLQAELNDQEYPPICSVFAGTNDLNGGSTAANVYSSTQSWASARRSAGCKVIVGTTLSRANPVDTNRGTLNSDIETGFLNGGLATDAVVEWGLDPTMSQNGNYSTSWYADPIHPSAAGNSIGAIYWAHALMRAAGQGYVPICSTVVVDNAVSGTWRMQFNGGTTGPGPAVTAGLTQSVPLFYIGPKYKIVSTEIRTLTAFTGTATLAATLGDSVGTATFYDANSYDLKAAVSNTNFHNATPNTSKTLAGSNLTLALTATTNNLTSITAGSVQVTFCVASVP